MVDALKMVLVLALSLALLWLLGGVGDSLQSSLSRDNLRVLRVVAGAMGAIGFLLLMTMDGSRPPWRQFRIGFFFFAAIAGYLLVEHER